MRCLTSSDFNSSWPDSGYLCRLCERVIAVRPMSRHARPRCVLDDAAMTARGDYRDQAFKAVAQVRSRASIAASAACSNAACLAQVPMDQPKHALDMITRFTRSEDFGARASAHLVAASSQTASSSAAAA